MSESPPLKKHKLPEANSTLDGSLANGSAVLTISKKRKSTSASTAAANGSVDGDVKPNSEDPAFRYVCPIASPYANKKLSKKLAKLIPKANKVRLIRKGVREVQKSLRKGLKGILLLAADTSPVDIIVHLPLVCEDAAMPYCFLPSKKELGRACGSKRSMCALMILPATAAASTPGQPALDAAALGKYTSIYERCHALAAELVRAPTFGAQALGAPDTTASQ